ncbi:MAG: hypothetical protein ACI39E_06875, partial [Acutalibacteraceae bacterium]
CKNSTLLCSRVECNETEYFDSLNSLLDGKHFNRRPSGRLILLYRWSVFPNLLPITLGFFLALFPLYFAKQIHFTAQIAL